MAEFDEFALHSPVPGGLSVAMRITSFLITAAVDGRPGRRRFAQSHLRVTSRRYQASSAAAVTANTRPAGAGGSAGTRREPQPAGR